MNHVVIVYNGEFNFFIVEGFSSKESAEEYIRSGEAREEYPEATRIFYEAR